MFVCAADGVVLEWNPCLQGLTGGLAADRQGKPLLDMVAEDQKDLVSLARTRHAGLR